MVCALLESVVSRTPKSHQRVRQRDLKAQQGHGRLAERSVKWLPALLARGLRSSSEPNALAAMRDTLLPKPTWGELRLTEAKTVIEAEA